MAQQVIPQNPLDPNYFLQSNLEGTFNGISQDQSGYGVLPAVEQNQTYFAYFNAVGDTTPELINQTQFFIKYLIDENGEIYKPNSNLINTSNVYNNFPSTSPITITSQDATVSFSNLLGEQYITDIGTVRTIMTTETGSENSAIMATMSIVQSDSPYLENTLPTYYFKANKNASQEFTGNSVVYAGSGFANSLEFDDVISNADGNWSNNDGGNNYGAYTFNSSTPDGVSISFNLDLSYRVPYGTQFKIYIQYSSDNGSTWDDLQLQSSPSGFLNNDGDTITLTYTNNGFKLINIRTVPSSFSSGDKIRYKFQMTSGNSMFAYLYYAGVPNVYTSIYTTSNIQGTFSVPKDNIWYSIGNVSPDNILVKQGITFTSTMSQFLNSNYTQLLPSSSQTFGYNTPITLQIQPGDYIRVNYDPSTLRKIYSIEDNGSGRIKLVIYPAISSTDFKHFTIVRVIQDGNNIIINKKKNSIGSFTGFIIPNNISTEFRNKIPNIINKLQNDGILNQ